MDLSQRVFRHSSWAAVLLLTACVKTEIIPEILAPQLVVAPAALSLTVGETKQLSATYTDETGADKSRQIQWRMSNPSVASVDASGLLNALTPGQSWAVALAPGGLTDSTLVTVAQNADAVAKVEITTTANLLQPGETLQFSAKVYNSNGQEMSGQTVAWASADPAVLTISASGLSTAQNAGLAAVTASVAGVFSARFGVNPAARRFRACSVPIWGSAGAGNSSK